LHPTVQVVVAQVLTGAALILGFWWNGEARKARRITSS